MGKIIDLAGMTYGRLTVQSFVEVKHFAIWKCICVCGNEVTTSSNQLRTGKKKSCGCLKEDVMSFLHTKHGMAHRGKRIPEYGIWSSMKSRCYNPNRKKYPEYGGRGITVCDTWKNSFIQFYSDMGSRPSELHTIDRINNDGNYEPGNCRWATMKEQSNNRRDTVMITYNGKTQSRAAWAEDLGVNYSGLRSRLKSMGHEAAMKYYLACK